jgi:nicotinamide mononucleotide transporter
MPDTGFFSSNSHEVAAAYLGACASALAIANGVLLFFRFKESWYPWIAYSLVSIAYMALSGFWIFIVLQLGYLTNAIYGYLHWAKYIKSAEQTASTQPENNN